MRIKGLQDMRMTSKKRKILKTTTYINGGELIAAPRRVYYIYE